MTGFGEFLPCPACAETPARHGDEHDPDCTYGIDLDGVIAADVGALTACHSGAVRHRRPAPVELLELLRGPAAIGVWDVVRGEPWRVVAGLEGPQLTRTLYRGRYAVHTVRTAVDVPVPGWTA